jgi:hypothetical protein
MAAHPQKAAVVLAILADEHGWQRSAPASAAPPTRPRPRAKPECSSSSATASTTGAVATSAAQLPHAVSDSIMPSVPRRPWGTGSLVTRRWRKGDSNRQSHAGFQGGSAKPKLGERRANPGKPPEIRRLLPLAAGWVSSGTRCIAVRPEHWRISLRCRDHRPSIFPARLAIFPVRRSTPWSLGPMWVERIEPSRPGPHDRPAAVHTAGA